MEHGDQFTNLQNAILANLAQQLAAQQGQTPPQPKTGFLEPGQQGIGDVFRNPSQEQVNAGVAGLLSALNPNASSPVVAGLAGGLNAIQSQRARDLQARQEAYRQRNKELNDRVSNLSQVFNLAGSLRSEDRLERGEKRAQEQFVEGRTQFNAEIPQADGSYVTRLVKKDTKGNYFDVHGDPVDLPDGTRLSTTGKTEADLVSGGFSKLTTGALTQTQKDLMDASHELDQLEKITNDELFQTLSVKGRSISKIGKLLDFGTGIGGEKVAELSKELTGVDPIEFASQTRVALEKIERYYQTFRHRITGAQASFKEFAQLKKAILNGDLPPHQAVASLNANMQQLRSLIDQQRGYIREGIDVRALETLQPGETIEQEVNGVKVKITRKPQ